MREASSGTTAWWRDSLFGAAARWALDVVLAESCLRCGEWARAARLRLCLPCRAQLRLDAGRCRSCSRPAPPRTPRAAGAGHGVCGSCLRRPPPADRCVAVWAYTDPLDQLVQRFKFHRDVHLGKGLAVEAFARRGAALRSAELLVPVPLHWTRRMRRGFNQAELIARTLSECGGMRWSPALRRIRRGRPQSTLSRSRRTAEVRGAFAVADAERVRGRRVALIDDVVTTGSTLSVAARALRRAGARSVMSFVLARAAVAGPLGPRSASASNHET